MHLRTKLIGAVGIAALVGAGGFAFTAGNTIGGDNVAGYQTATVEGLAVSATYWLPDAADNATVTEAQFTLSTTPTAAFKPTNAALGVNQGTGAQVFAHCTTVTSTNILHCPLATPMALQNITAVQLAYYGDGAAH